MNVKFFGSSLTVLRCGALALASLLPLSTHAAGTPVAWGANDASQSQVPPGLTNIVSVAGGASHSLALRGDGTVVAWGFNLSGQTTVPSNLTSVAAIAAGSTYSMALRSNGTVVVWGSQAAPPAGLSSVTAIAAGWSHCLALKNDSTVVAWGSQTDVPAGLTNVVAIAAGNGQSLALKTDGTVVAWGDNAYGKTSVPTNLSSVIAIAAGGDHCLALKRNGTIVAWGRNTEGQTTVPANLNTAIAIGAGAMHSLALRADGSILAWGDNTYRQLEINSAVTGFVALAAGGYHSLAIKGDNFPSILVQPYSQNVYLTKSVTLQVVAAGAAPLTYQWQHNGATLPGATKSALTLSNFQVSDGGSYAVTVANAYGTVTSATAVLTPVGGPPEFLLAPQDQSVVCGDTATFQVNVDGSGPFGYQWYFQGSLLAGATGSSLILKPATNANAGQYSVIVTNSFGSVTGAATLTLTIVPPTITSSLTASGKQGQPFTYTITALHSPVAFAAANLPLGLTLNTNTGVISGIPLQNGSFGVTLTAYNICTSDSQTLALTFASSVPTITSSGSATATEGQPFTYQITATESPTAYSAQNLPVGILIDPKTGQLAGSPVYAGTFTATISASNQWGVGSAPLRFTIANATVSGLSIDDRTFTTSYHSPYLLDFFFTLRDNNNPDQGNGIVTQPTSLSATCMENWPVGPAPLFLATWPDLPNGTTLVTNYVAETGIFMSRGSGKVFKGYLVLDYTDSISDPALTGDSNGDGLSDAVDNMVKGAQYFVDQQPGGTQLGVYEFHNEFVDPQKVIGLTRNKALLDQNIAGIWTNYVTVYGYGASRCWDAVSAAIQALGQPNPDEQHCVVFVSDGRDYSSTTTVPKLISQARASAVQVYCIAFGNSPDLTTLQNITYQTKGRLYVAQTPADLYQQFALVSKDIQAQYVLRWASVRRDTNQTFAPFFLISYQGQTAAPPAWDWYYATNIITTVDTNSDPAVTNSITNTLVLWANSVIPPYNPAGYAGPVTNGGYAGPITTNGYIGTVTKGSLRLVLDEEVEPTGVTLRATYLPRYVRQFRFHYQANWPCTARLDATNSGEMLSGWTMTETNDVDGSKWLLLTSSDPQNQATSLPFAGFGPLVTFKFADILSAPSNAFNFFTVDSSIYTNITFGGQSFDFESGSTNAFVTSYPTLPHGTPVPWLIANGYTTPATSNAWATAELDDADKDGMPAWKEYRANTNPRDAKSVFGVRNLTRLQDGRFQVIFSSATNRTYRVECSNDLLTWQTVQDQIPGTGADITVVDTRFVPGAANFFYRVLVY